MEKRTWIEEEKGSSKRRWGAGVLRQGDDGDRHTASQSELSFELLILKGSD